MINLTEALPPINVPLCAVVFIASLLIMGSSRLIFKIIGLGLFVITGASLLCAIFE